MRIMNLGSLNIDKVYMVERFVQKGGLISAQRMETVLGGKGFNQSLALARAGARVLHVGAVGQDGVGLRDMLQAEGVDVTGILTAPGLSGHTVIQVDPSGHHSVIITAGANVQITPTMIDAGLLQCQPGDWFLTQNETSCVAYGMEQAKAAGLRVAFNPWPMNEALRDYPLELVDVFVLHLADGASLGGLAPTADPEAVLERLLEIYPKAAVALALGDGGSLCAAHGQRARQKLFPVNVVNTVAAVDTFCGFFLWAYDAGEPLEEVLRLASAAAALAMSRAGAWHFIPTLAQVREFLKKGL